MVRTVQSSDRSPAVRTHDRFYCYYMDDEQDMVSFLLEFQNRWLAASAYGVIGWDGVLRYCRMSGSHGWNLLPQILP